MAGARSAIAPYMGENAFIAFTVCKVLGMRLADGVGRHLYRRRAVCAHDGLASDANGWWRAYPPPCDIASQFGMGLFLTFIGLNETGLVRLGVPGAPVQPGHLTFPLPVLGCYVRDRFACCPGHPQGPGSHSYWGSSKHLPLSLSLRMWLRRHIV